MVIQLKAKDFKKSSWEHGETCPIACAVKTAIKKYYGKEPYVNERGRHVIIGNLNQRYSQRYSHKYYSFLHYKWDRIKAFFCSYGEMVLREITIEGYPPVEKSEKTPLEVVEELENQTRIRYIIRNEGY